MNKYNIWNKWDPLKVCMLGNNYTPEFFNGLPDKVGNPLKRICEETLEDLHGFKNILQDFGAEVIQPEMDPSERFLDNPRRYPRGPLQPRDFQLVLGNHCLSNGGDHPAINQALEKYHPVDTPVFKGPQIENKERYDFIAGSDFPSWENFCENKHNKDYFNDHVWQELLDFSKVATSSASAFMIGNELIIGIEETNNNLFDSTQCSIDYTQITPFDQFRVTTTEVDGHVDGNYHPVKPGAILSLSGVQNYEETFPGWDVCYLPDQSWSKVKGFLQLKNRNQGKWWLAGEENNDEFTNFVETWLGDWVGYVEETVFDVNVLMLDEHHCCVSNPHNAQVNAFLKKHNIEPVHVPWRHRFFWDGGLHCITLDLYREGIQKEYF